MESNHTDEVVAETGGSTSGTNEVVAKRRLEHNSPGAQLAGLPNDRQLAKLTSDHD